MIHTENMKLMIGSTNNGLTIDGIAIDVTALSPAIQQAVITLAEWQADIKWQELELSKLRRASFSLSADIAAEINKLRTPDVQPMVESAPQPAPTAKKSTKKKAGKKHQFDDHDGRGPG